VAGTGRRAATPCCGLLADLFGRCGGTMPRPASGEWTTVLSYRVHNDRFLTLEQAEVWRLCDSRLGPKRPSAPCCARGDLPRSTGLCGARGDPGIRLALGASVGDGRGCGVDRSAVKRPASVTFKSTRKRDEATLRRQNQSVANCSGYLGSCPASLLRNPAFVAPQQHTSWSLGAPALDSVPAGRTARFYFPSQNHQLAVPAISAVR